MNKDKGKPRFVVHKETNIPWLYGTRITVDLYIRTKKHKGKKPKTKHVYFGVEGEPVSMSHITAPKTIEKKVMDYIKRGRYHDWDYYVEREIL